MKEIWGQKFGKLTVLFPIDEKYQKKIVWWCKCDCGNEKAIVGTKLRNGHTKSCGCFVSQRAKEKNTKHGHSTRLYGTTGEYNSWAGIIQRCTNPNNQKYMNYGGRGIKVCNRWLESFENFFEDMGEKPKPKKKYSIDRIDNDSHYSCGHCTECSKNNWTANCRWATSIQQANNKGYSSTNRWLTFNNQTKTITEWANHLNINRRTIMARLRNGWSIERTLTEAPNIKK